MTLRCSEIRQYRPAPRARPRLVSTALALLIAAATVAAGQWAEARYIQLDGVAEVKTRYSRGCETVEDISRLAKQKGIDAVLFGDRARDQLEYGVWPLERILKKTLSGPSLFSSGVATYLAEINSLNGQQAILIPGAEVTPFYYWTGSVWQDNLVAHDADRNLWLLGLASSQAYEQLPIAHGSFSTKYQDRFLNAALSSLALCLIFSVLAYKNRTRWLTLPLAMVFFLLAINNHPFRSSPFDPYQGDRGVEPIQEVAGYVADNGGMAFLTGLDSPPPGKSVGSVSLETLAHAEDLVSANRITGFQAVAPAPVRAAQAGRQWDGALTDYTQGKRAAPVWGYGGNNFLCEDMEGPVFGSVRTVFLVREKSREAVLDAMAHGRMYAVRQPDANRLSLDEFVVREKELGHKAEMGETLVSTGAPEIHLKVRDTGGEGKKARVTLIRNGTVIREVTATLPHQLVHTDAEVPLEGTVFYRVLVNASEVDHLASNPIFVRFPGGLSETVKVPARPGKPPVAPKPPKPPAEEESPPSAPAKTEQAKAPEAGEPAAAKPMREPEEAKSAIPPPPPPPPAPARPKAAPAKINPPKPPEALAKAKPPAAVKQTRPASSKGETVTIAAAGATLRSGPGTVFPEVGRAEAGEKLLLIRRTRILVDGHAWLMVDTGSRRAYLWGKEVE